MHECYFDLKTRGIADLHYNEEYNVWILTRINIPISRRGKGHGSQLLDKILADADFEGATLCLTVSASDGLSNAQLDRWYRRHGFEVDKNPIWLGSPEPHEYILRRYPQLQRMESTN